MSGTSVGDWRLATGAQPAAAKGTPARVAPEHEATVNSAVHWFNCPAQSGSVSGCIGPCVESPPPRLSLLLLSVRV
jgi:hypothetical protein